MEKRNRDGLDLGNLFKAFTGFFGLVVCLIICHGGFANELKWRLKKDDSGIRIYSRKIDGSAVEEIRGVMSVKAPLESILDLFEDARKVPEWMYRCKEFREIHSTDPAHRCFYFQQGLPWPVSDRDIVTYRVRTQNPRTKTVTYTITKCSDLYPVQENIVRVPFFKALWRFIPRDSETVEIDYHLHLDPGGSIPKWIVNQMSVDAPFITLKQFRALLSGPVTRGDKAEMSN